MPKFEINRPLFSHTKLDYYECYAKTVLEYLFPERFSNLTMADKPDIQSLVDDIGVEVTVAESKKSIEAERLYSWLENTDHYRKQRNIERIKQCGAEYKKGMLLSYGGDNFELVNNAVDRKNKKLQSAGYASFKEYHLFIFSSTYADDSMLQNEYVFLQNIHAGEYWGRIYVLVPGELYCFDFERATYERFVIDSNTQMQCAVKARQMVEEGE